MKCGVAPRDPRNNSNVNGGGHVVMVDKNRARVGAIARTYIKVPRRADTSGNGGWQNLRGPSVPRRFQTSPVSNSPIVDRALSHCGRLQPASSRALEYRGPPRPVIVLRGGRLHILGDPELICPPSVAYERFCGFDILAARDASQVRLYTEVLSPESHCHASTVREEDSMNRLILMVDDRVEVAAFPDRAALSKPPATAAPPRFRVPTSAYALDSFLTPNSYWLRTTPSCTCICGS